MDSIASPAFNSVKERGSHGALRSSVSSHVTRHFLRHRYSVTVDAGMGQVYHQGFCRGNRNVRIHAEARKRACQRMALLASPDVGVVAVVLASELRMSDTGVLTRAPIVSFEPFPKQGKQAGASNS